MAFDGIFMNKIARGLAETAAGARVDKIAQPSRDEIILHLRWRGGGGKLLVSANGSSPRVHFTKTSPENPKTAPMFCMLLRKHLGGGRLLSVNQLGLDRALHLAFECTNEMGDIVTNTLAAEIMGSRSNIILIGSDGRIIDACKRVDFEASRVRQVLPGMRYEPPPAQDKLSLLEYAPGDVLARLEKMPAKELSAALSQVLEGVSPIVAREIAFFASRGQELEAGELSGEQRERLRFFLEGMADSLRSGEVGPTMLLLPGKPPQPKDFSYMPIRQYGAAMITREYESCGELLDDFYAERDNSERIRRKSGDLLRVLANGSDRIRRKLQAQREQLLECARRDELRVKADILSSNLYSLEKGMCKAVLENFYDGGNKIEIALDPWKTPVQNAQRYYTLYRKADTAEKMLAGLITSAEQELAYLDSVFDSLSRATAEAELESIRRELAQSGYLKRPKAERTGKNAANQKPDKLPPLRFRSSDGFLIVTGRNNLQNDRLTLKEANGADLWFHTQKIPGSHTIVFTEGKTVPARTIEQACVIAATHSQARASAKVPVDFTQARNVKKPGGAKPGMVIYDRYKTVIVDPDEELVKTLAE